MQTQTMQTVCLKKAFREYITENTQAHDRTAPFAILAITLHTLVAVSDCLSSDHRNCKPDHNREITEATL